MAATFKQVPTGTREATVDALPPLGLGPVHFYDSANPAAVPSRVFAACYANGFVWPQFQVQRMAFVIFISVQRDHGWARVARVIDVENGAALPEDVVPFIQSRRHYGHNDATAYVNRSNWPIVHSLVKAAGLSCRYWVSTLDGTQNVSLPDGTPAWAVQYQGGMNAPYDVSILHGINDFNKP